MQHKLMKKTLSTNQTRETSQPFQQQIFPIMTFLSEDSLASLLVSLENAGDLQTPEGLSFLTSLGFSKTKDPDILFLKTSKVYLVMTKEKLSRQYLEFSPTWGMSINGRFLTAKISESPRIGKECSLSDILEENPDQKYFLSEKLIIGFLNKREGVQWEVQDFEKTGNITYDNSPILETVSNRPIHQATRFPLKFLQRNQKNIEGDYSFTIDGANTGGVRQDMKIRRLTPLECERLQGFPDGWTEGVSDTQRYKQLGNAVTINVVYEVAKRL